MTTDRKTSPELSVVFPVLNEAENIAAVIEDAAGYLEAKGIDYEIVVVDDGSDDGTAAVLSAMGRRCRVLKAVLHSKNGGYGAALRSGMAAARGRYVLLCDGDGQFRMNSLERLWPERKKADLVLGFRDPRRDPWLRRIAGWLYGRLLVTAALRVDVRDVNCGFKLLSRRLVSATEFVSTGALISAEIAVRAEGMGARRSEVGVEHYPRLGGRPTGLRPRVVLTMIRELFRYRRTILSGRSAPPGEFAEEV